MKRLQRRRGKKLFESIFFELEFGAIYHHLCAIYIKNVNYKRNIGFRWQEKRIPTMGVPLKKKKKNVVLPARKNLLY